MAWMATYEGIPFDLANPSPRDVRISDIAWPLATIPRFNGHTKVNYSVAEHSIHATTVAALYTDNPADQLYVLLHDAHEAYTGDIASPVKAAIGPAVDHMQWRIQEAIHKALCLHPPSERQQRIIEFADAAMLEMERNTVMYRCMRPWGVADDTLDLLRAAAFPGQTFERSAFEDASHALSGRLPLVPTGAGRVHAKTEFMHLLDALLRRCEQGGYLIS